MKWLLGICGDAAAVSSPSHISYLRENGISLKIILSEYASKFVTVDALEAFAGVKVFTSLFDRGEGITVPHVELVNQADIYVIMPATANTIAKIAHGMADDLISASVLHARIPVLIVPALNAHLYQKPSVLRNIKTILEDGIYIMDISGEDSINLLTRKKEHGTMPPLNDVVRTAEGILQNTAVS